MIRRVFNIKLIGKRGQKFAIEMDDGSSIVLTGETILRNNIRRQQELSDADVQRLIAEDEYIRARMIASGYLALRRVSEKQLRDYLLKKGFTRQSIQRVISEMKEKGQVDDEKFAQLFVKDRMKLKPMGPLRLVAELKKRGIKDEIIDSVTMPFFKIDAQKELATRLAKKKINSLEKYDSLKRKQRLYSFLKQQGFEKVIIADVVRHILGGDMDKAYE
ncbi:regulatory protein RecX [Candidatus Sumerlaeota bacterium]|nr:regulatory protein RecX [Candidatus Sumerlaeota bacterium]